MRRLANLLLLAMALLAIGCASKKEGAGGKPLSDWQKICDAHRLSGASARGAPPQQEKLVAMKYLAENLTDPAAMRFLADTARVTRPEGRALLIAEAKQHGIDRCAFAEAW